MTPPIIMREEANGGVKVPPWLLWPLVGVAVLGGGGAGVSAFMRGQAEERPSLPASTITPADLSVARLEVRMTAVEQAVAKIGNDVQALPAKVEQAVRDGRRR